MIIFKSGGIEDKQSAISSLCKGDELRRSPGQILSSDNTAGIEYRDLEQV